MTLMLPPTAAAAAVTLPVTSTLVALYTLHNLLAAGFICSC
jgi:hypothetical protein